MWNIRGINARAMWDNVRDKITESFATIVCLQETKKDFFNSAYISKFCPRALNKFSFSPSFGASGGLLTVWNGNLFNGDVICLNCFSITVKFISLLSGKTFHLSNIYGLSAPAEKASFIHWLYNFDVSAFDEWALVGDFNFIRVPENKNKSGGSDHEDVIQ